MKTHASVTIKNKTYPYSLERTRAGSIKMVSKDANINQEFLAEDVSAVILDLPNLIHAEQQHKSGHTDVIRFRVTDSDRLKIEKKATEKGYSSVSRYLRDLALG